MSASPSSGPHQTNASQYLDQQTETSDRLGLRPSWAVVVPVFNAERTVRRCVESVLAAGCDQILLVDDGSYDTTSTLLLEYEASSVKVLHLDENAGPAAARNHGARAATADWLVFLDADDVLDRDAIPTFAAHVDPQCALVRARFARMDDASPQARSGFLAGTFAVRRDLFEAADGYDEHLRFAENSDLLVRMQEAMSRYGWTETEVPDVTVLVESVGESRNYDDDRLNAAVRILEVRGDELTRVDRARYQAIAATNAARTRRVEEARAFAWAAMRSDPLNSRHLARAAAFGLGGRGQSAWIARGANPSRLAIVQEAVTHVQRTLARNHRRRWARFVGNLSTVLVRGYENDDASGIENGEWRLLDALADANLRCVFDVGAHHGDWTNALLDRATTPTIHCFEIERTTRARLQSSLGQDSRVVIADVGLAEAPGVVDLWLDPEHPDIASSTGPRPGNTSGSMVECAVDTGDSYLASHEITSVDFLKIDVEGAELRVLQGFADALSAGRIGAIQFEFNIWAPTAKVWLKDFYDLLEPHGYQIGKIFPTHVEWRSYTPQLEVFVRSNHLAVHRSRADIRDRVS